MTIPHALLQSLQDVAGFDEKSFTAVHESGEQVVSVRFNPAKQSVTNKSPRSFENPHFLLADKIPWSSYGFYLGQRPSFTFDPIFHAGAYYVQEASSMFLEQALRQTASLSQPLRVLDLCAAPGGKSTLLQSVISADSLLVSNDVIKSRAAVLEENITKWGTSNIVVTNNDPSHFARLENYFDVLVIDAPCSGSGLFRRDPEAINEWSENNVALCTQRQQRIIADAWPALKQDGILIYSTCSYSAAEDEAILDWLMESFSVQSMRLSIDNTWGIVESVSQQHRLYGYRFYPNKLKGEGFFIAVVQKKDGGEFAGIKLPKAGLEKLIKTEEALVRPWLKQEPATILFHQKESIIALPAALQTELSVLQSALYIKKAGVTIGKLAGKDFIPDHQLALSPLVNDTISVINFNKQQAIQYLRKEDMQLDTTLRGWVLVQYEGFSLGWIKVLPNRFNNYYPKEWRILKKPV